MIRCYPMKKRLIAALFALTLLPTLFMGGARAVTSETAGLFLDASTAYNEGRYEDAAKGFTAVAETGARNAALFYNLGNAWFKSGDLGRAILWYERAKRLAPTDPDLALNLDYARSLTKDAAEPESALQKVLFFAKSYLSLGQMSWVLLISNAVLWAALGLGLRRPHWALKALVLVSLAVMLVLGPAAAHVAYTQRFQDQGVVLAKELPVRAGRDDKATTLFTLHAGARVLVQEGMNGYVRVRFGDKIGWSPEQDVGVI